MIASALDNIYHKKFNPDTELEPGIFRETVDIFNLAAATGLSDAVIEGVKMPSIGFLTAIKSNITVFSAFRTHRMQNEIAGLMTDAGGNLRTFSAFSKLALDYTDHKNKAWLRTEYDTAVRRAHQAADWQQFEAERDVLPNLEWIPSTSPNSGIDHQVFWGTVLPIDDAFWNEHRPGDRWNCKCELRNTDKGTTAAPHSSKPTDMPARGLDSNPGVDGKIFSDSHPYEPRSCSTCPFAGGKLFDLRDGQKRHCEDCERLDKCVERTTIESRSDHRKEYDKLSKDNRYIGVQYDRDSGGVKATHRGHNANVTDRRTFFGGTMNSCDLERELQQLIFSSGHSVIFCDEQRKNRVGDTLCSLDMRLDGVLMDIASVTTRKKGYGYILRRKNHQLSKFNARTDIHEEADTLCLYFHDKEMYRRQKLTKGVRFLNEGKEPVRIKHIKCIINDNGTLVIKDFDI